MPGKKTCLLKMLSFFVLLIQRAQERFALAAGIPRFIFSDFQAASEVLCSPRKVWVG